MTNLKQVFNNQLQEYIKMEYLITFIVVIFVIFYLFRPTSKQEKINFESKNNWRGGF